MLKERLNPCATLLYHWLHNYHQADPSTPLNLEYFQVWSTEFLEEPIGVREIDQAFLRLMQLQLVKIENGRLQVIPLEKQPRISLKPLPEKLWKLERFEDRVFIAGFVIASAILLGVLSFVVSQPKIPTEATPLDQNMPLEQVRDLDTGSEKP